MKRGFTLLELIVVIIIIGILAAVGFVQYTKVVEKARTAEAKTILGQIRVAQQAYYQEYGNYSSNVSNLSVIAPTNCTSIYYFNYSTNTTTARAERCTASGKIPNVNTSYNVTLEIENATWGGSAGYY